MGVTAIEKMSVMCAVKGQLVVCLWRGSLELTIIDRMRGQILFRLYPVRCIQEP